MLVLDKFKVQGQKEVQTPKGIKIISKKLLFLKIMCMSVYVHHVRAGACRGQMRALDPLELQLEVGVDGELKNPGVNV